MRWKREKAHLIFIFRQSPNSKFYKTTNLNSSDKNSVEIILAKFGFLLKLIWCIYDQSFLHPIEVKYRSAIAPLVFFIISINFDNIVFSLKLLLYFYCWLSISRLVAVLKYLKFSEFFRKISESQFLDKILDLRAPIDKI